MIRITNETKRRRSYRHLGMTLWIEPDETIEIDGPLPPLDRRRAFAGSGLRITAPQETGQEAAGRASRHSGAGGSGRGRENATSGRAAGAAAVEIPADWRNLSGNALKELAGHFVGNPVRTRAAAVDAVAAEVDRRGGDPTVSPPSAVEMTGSIE